MLDSYTKKDRATRMGTVIGGSPPTYLSWPGTSGSDRIEGTSRGDRLAGNGGDDRLWGGGGNDTLSGDFDSDLGSVAMPGADSLNGWSGRDLLYGGAGDDTLYGGDGRDTLIGGPGADRLVGYQSNQHDSHLDVVSYAHLGPDQPTYANLLRPHLNGGGAEGDSFIDIQGLIGGAGDDQLTAGWRNSLLDGGAGNDRLEAGRDADTLIGGSGEDWADYDLYTTDLHDPVRVSLADPSINTGYAAGDVLDGIEHVTGTTSSDTLIGDAGANILRGIEGSDLLQGSDGADRLLGDDIYENGGYDTLEGGAGDDYLYGGDGGDVLSGSLGADTFALYAPGYGADVILDFESGTDRLVISAVFFPPGFSQGMDLGGSGRFILGDAPTIEGGQFFYRADLGHLSFDRDGTGLGAPTLMAIFAPGTGVSASDFVVWA